MYLTPTKDHWACDIEADKLLDKATCVWCVTVENCITGESHAFTQARDLIEFWDSHPDAILVGHNFLAYDAVMLNRFWGTRIPVGKIVDTFILSQVYNPSYPRPQGCRKGPHSLDAWGIRLGYPKGDFDDFSKLSDEMLTYCARDTKLTALLFRRLTERMRQVGFSEFGLEIEHKAWHIIQNKQRRNGFPFNIKKAMELYVELRARQEELQTEIYRLWPPRLEVVASYSRPFKKDGEPSANYLRHCEQYPRVDVSPNETYDCYDYVAFNLGSPSQRIEKLLELGWEPVNFTKKTKKGGGGNPQVDEDSLLAFAELSGKTELVALAKWIVCYSRANMVNTWLNAYDEKTKAIHGKLFIAATLRYRHTEPNSANIPGVRTKKVNGEDVILYGEEGAWAYECRDLFWAGDDESYTLVGIDGTGIQNRCLIHGLIKTIGEEPVAPFKELSLEGDIHKRNIEVLGLAHKPAAKKFYYTLMMGGGGARLAADQVQFGTHMTAKEGEAKKKALVATIPGFQALIDSLQRELEKTGRIKLCDGTPVLVSSPHMVIPYLLQGDESRLMKLALIYLDEEIRRNKMSAFVYKAADIHDEWQWKVHKDYVDKFIEIALPCFLRAGETFKYNIKIEGDAKIGRTWAETH